MKLVTVLFFVSVLLTGLVMSMTAYTKESDNLRGSDTGTGYIPCIEDTYREFGLYTASAPFNVECGNCELNMTEPVYDQNNNLIGIWYRYTMNYTFFEVIECDYNPNTTPQDCNGKFVEGGSESCQDYYDEWPG